MLDYLLGRWEDVKQNSDHVQRETHRHGLLPFNADRLALDVLARLLRRGVHPEQALFAARKLVGEPAHRSLLWAAIDDFKRWLWRHIVEPNVEDDDLRFFFTMFDAGTTMLQGILEDDLILRGFDAANDEDLREWLLRHGAQRITVDEGPFVRALYDMAFAYENGDIDKPNMAAGTAVGDMLRLFFTYRGAFAWKMQAGMGDTVFTPFYEVLKSRGVKFKLFHWITDLHLSADRRFVDTIEYVEQVKIKDGAEYDPFVEVKGLPCWPSEPKWEQIEDGHRLHEQKVDLEWQANPLGVAPQKLRRGRDFDVAVLGISVAALPEICKELIEDDGNPGFGRMIENSHTTMTQAFQLWLARPSDRLGWPYSANSVMTSYVEPMDTYADMNQLLPAEAWPPDVRVDDIAYFCAVLKDEPGDTQQRCAERAFTNAVEYLERDAGGIWPNSFNREGTDFDWNVLVDPSHASGAERFTSQFWRANFQATERYVLTPAGSVKHRLQADESGYENLFLAGDWVKTGLDAGCVEAAVMGGMQASRAICGVPEDIVGEDTTWLSGNGATKPARRHGLPPYIDYGGLATCPSPVDCDDSTLYSFFLEADHAKLADLCDRVFAQASHGAFEVLPLGHHVMLTFGIVEKIKPQLAPWSRMGFATERQAALWVPVVAVSRQNGGPPDAVTLGWFVPYMWVDNPLSLAGGREIYGFNKNWGWIDLPQNGADQAAFALDAYGGNFDGGERAGRHRLIEVTGASGSSPERGERLWDGVEALAGEIRHVLRDVPVHLPDQIFDDIVSRGGPPQLFLKQFRAVSNGELASEQQITDGGTTVKRIQGWPLLSEFEVTLHNLDSHPVAAELGVESQTTGLAFQIEMDFVLDDGQVLWQAPVS
ncbi:MAG: acetoacetate decarboxylase family protein, partial [Thermoleophilaceae bacterium]